MDCFIDSIDKITLDNLLKNILEEKLYYTNCIENIDNTEIILYGAGSLGDMAVNLLEKINIKPKYIIDISKDKIGKNIKGIKIVSPSDIKNIDRINSIVAICVVNYPYNPIKKSLVEQGYKNIIPFWDMIEYFKDKIKINNGWYCNYLSEDDKLNIECVYNKLSDELSKAFYIQYLYWRLKREEILFKDAKVDINDKYFISQVMSTLNQYEVFVDCGAYNGKSIEKFLKSVKENFKKIIAFEPDINNFIKLESYINMLNKNISKKIIAYQYGVGEYETEEFFTLGLDMAGRFGIDSIEYKTKIIKLDNFINNDKITSLKIHVEGDEYKVIKGALKKIKCDRPIIATTTYHNKEGMWIVPKLLMDNIENYSFFYKLHGYCGNGSVLYCLPKERLGE